MKYMIDDEDKVWCDSCDEFYKVGSLPKIRDRDVTTSFDCPNCGLTLLMVKNLPTEPNLNMIPKREIQVFDRNHTRILKDGVYKIKVDNGLVKKVTKTKR